jgi:hypothetical protein
MSVNRLKSHLLVLPEDDANRQIANGFLLEPRLNSRAIQVLPCAGGWGKVIEEFEANYAPKMRQNQLMMMALVIDSDVEKKGEIRSRNVSRFDDVRDRIPSDLKDRVFVLGSWIDPQKLKAAMHRKSLEAIGESLAEDCAKKKSDGDCAENTNGTWGHELLKHNEKELKRMVVTVKPFLFTE